MIREYVPPPRNAPTQLLDDNTRIRSCETPALLDDNTRRIRSLEVADAYKEKTALNFGGEKSKGRALLIGKAKLE